MDYSPNGAVSNFSISTSTDDPTFIKNIKLGIAIFYIIITPLIILGNALVISTVLVFIRHWHHYNFMLLSLAVADLLVGVLGCPLFAASFLMDKNVFHNRYACLFKVITTLLICLAPLFNITLIVIDRYISIVHPSFYFKYKSHRNIVITLAILWMYVLVLISLPLMGLNKYDENKRCQFYLVLSKEYYIFAMFLQLCACLCISLTLYCMILIKVRQITDRTKMYADITYTKLTAVVFLLFNLCWTPYIIVAPICYFIVVSDVTEVIKDGTVVLAFGKSAINPFVYFYMRTKFRTAFTLLLSTPITRWSTIRYHDFDVAKHSTTILKES